jgi:hypothetical protein
MILQGEKRTRLQMEEKMAEELRLKREIDQMRKDMEQIQVIPNLFLFRS